MSLAVGRARSKAVCRQLARSKLVEIDLRALRSGARGQPHHQSQQRRGRAPWPHSPVIPIPHALPLFPLAARPNAREKTLSNTFRRKMGLDCASRSYQHALLAGILREDAGGTRPLDRLRKREARLESTGLRDQRVDLDVASEVVRTHRVDDAAARVERKRRSSPGMSSAINRPWSSKRSSPPWPV